jgi:peptidyl-tRNA hydrolase, PTH1 family
MTPWLVVGLGNAGPKYEATRHNVGVMVVSQLAAALGAPLRQHRRCPAQLSEARLGPSGDSTPLLLARCSGFMNESGGPVSCLARFHKVPVEQIVVLHDELDLPMGAIRLKLGGGDNGHNGLRSLRRSLGSGEFHRVRLGIGRPNGRQDPADFVLKPFAAAEREELSLLVVEAADAVQLLIRSGLAAAQNAHNS